MGLEHYSQEVASATALQDLLPAKPTGGGVISGCVLQELLKGMVALLVAKPPTSSRISSIDFDNTCFPITLESMYS